MVKNNKNLFVIAVIAVVNALGYGIIIPVLYSYSHRFGLNDFENGLLFSLFSICQFISAPVIGRFSDTYGRKPLLIISLAGTAGSFLLMAFAPSAIFLFIARALDGLTAGNIPVASAVISDTLPPKDRARGFGIIAASFGFGFIFGPAISALTLPFGVAVPFLVAAAITTIALLLTVFILPETNVHKGLTHHGKLFDWKKLIFSLNDPRVGTTLLLSLIYSFAFGLFIYVYQPFSVKVLSLTAQQISINFTLFGLVGLISQSIVIPRTTRKFGDKTSLVWSLSVLVVTFFLFSVTRSLWVFIIISALHALANGFINPLVQTLLSKETDERSQGAIQGLNASYMSLGLIFGPIVGGLLALIAVPLPFLLGSVVILSCVVLANSTRIK